MSPESIEYKEIAVIGKEAVKVESPGFIVNRILIHD